MVLYGKKVESELSETAVAAFNSKFTSYEGDAMTATQVNALLNVVFAHNQTEAMNLNGKDYIRVSGVVTLDENDNATKRVLGNSKYKIECKTGDNGLINEIVITEVISDLLTPDDTNVNENGIDNIQSTGENIINALNGLN